MKSVVNFSLSILFVFLSFTKVMSQDTLKSVKSERIPEKEVLDPIWNSCPVTTVPVNPQNIIAPTMQESTVSELQVRSIHDGKNIAFLIEWIDSTRNASVDVSKFSDQVAIQTPMDTNAYPSFMMGNQSGRVHIIHWKALWQDDIEKGYRDVKDLHPNYWSDLYYFTETKDSVYARNTTVHDVKSKEGKNYMHGAYAGNPMSIFDRKNPSEEAVAEGFGTLTTQKNQNASAWGVWQANKWRVIIVRPISSEDEQDSKLGQNNIIAFAVWNGEAKNIGARKHYSMWYPLQIK